MVNFFIFGGKVIEEINVGWEVYGNFNENKDNVILIIYYFLGLLYVVGKYMLSDVFVGYWDSIIGFYKVIDIKKYFVVSVDLFVNLNVYDDNVIIMGLVLINFCMGKVYGMSFFVVIICDFVNV